MIIKHKKNKHNKLPFCPNCKVPTKVRVVNKTQWYPVGLTKVECYVTMVKCYRCAKCYETDELRDMNYERAVEALRDRENGKPTIYNSIRLVLGEDVPSILISRAIRLYKDKYILEMLDKFPLSKLELSNVKRGVYFLGLLRNNAQVENLKNVLNPLDIDMNTFTL